MKSLILTAILVYQRTLSPDHGPIKVLFPQGFCRFYPSCSAYGYESIRRFGAPKGSYLAMKRLFRCNPFSNGGVDPVPEQKQRD